MKRSEEYDYSFTAELEVTGYSMGYAHSYIMNMVNIFRQCLKEGQITEKQYRQYIAQCGFKDWSDEDIVLYANDNKEAHKRFEKEGSSAWMNCCKVGREHIEGKLEAYVKLQDKVIDTAQKYELFKRSPIKSNAAYGGVVVLARCRRNKVYIRYPDHILSEILGMDKNIIVNVFRSVQYIDFDIYALDFVKEKSKVYNHMYSVDIRINEVAVGISELIYRMIIWDVDINIVRCVSELLESEQNLYQNQIIELVKKLLEEHIRRMNKVVKDTGYPVGVILQMMDYPYLDKKKYDKCVESINKILGEL